MRALHNALAFSVGRDLLIALLACAAAVLVSLTVQLEMTKQKLRENSLDRAAQYIARHLQTDAAGVASLAIPPGQSSASIGYPAVVVDRNGRMLFERPAGLEPALVNAITAERIAVPKQQDRLAPIRFFTLVFGEKRIVGAARLATPSGRSPPNVGYPVVVFDRDGRLLLARPSGLDPALVDALSKQRLAAPDQEDRLGSIRFFALALDVHVHHLRRRLAEAGARVSITTVRGHGYALRGHDA